MKKSLLIATAVSGIACLPLMATPAIAQAMTPTDYVMTTGASDLYERQSAQIVLATTADPKITSFATMMIDAHTNSSKQVQAAAIKAKVRPAPPKLMPAQAEMIAQLRAETGAARDAVYIAQQRAAHGQALTVQKAYAEGGTAPSLKIVAGKIVPVVQDHIRMLKAM